ncbi:hypothetical protein LN475_17915 [Xanthomonas vesicatoria]|nr:hypothetical protein [Xanthomonas vesicatoria]
MSKANERRQGMSSVRTSGPVLGGVLLLLAAWFGWNSYAQWREDAISQDLEQARDRAVQDVGKAMAAQATQLDAVLKQPPVVGALAAGDALAAASAIRERFKGAEDVQVLPGDLAAAYANPKDFGYARLSLLESALVAERAQVRVVRDAKQVRLGVAAAVRLGAQPAVAYARLPLLRLTGPLDAIAVPGSAYLALRQGSYNVAQQGDAGLADAAETLAKPLGTSGLRVAAAVPQNDSGPLGLGALGCAIVAALLALIAVLLVLASRGRVALPRRRAAAPPRCRRASDRRADLQPKLAARRQPCQRSARAGRGGSACAAAAGTGGADRYRDVPRLRHPRRGRQRPHSRRCRVDRPGHRQCDAGAGAA